MSCYFLCLGQGCFSCFSCVESAWRQQFDALVDGGAEPSSCGGSRVSMDSISSPSTGCSSWEAVGVSLLRTSEFLCFLLGLASKVIDRAEVPFSADDALRKAHRE